MSQPPLEPIAWIALVARWTELARASRAIPVTETRLRDSIAHLIAIEATTAALGELTQVPEIDRPHARALAEVSIRRAAGELDRLWRGEEWPVELLDACEAAEHALRRAIYAGLEALVVVGPEPFEVPEFDANPPANGTRDLALGYAESDQSTHRGTLAAMPPGSIAMPGEPIAWWCGRAAPFGADGSLPSGLAHVVHTEPLQVYRGLDERGRFTADTLAPITDELLPGLPMLVPLLLDGVRIGRFLQPRDAWLAMQRAALAGRPVIPVVTASGTSDLG
ncbi:MAG: hypothetical protein LW806_00745 [Planctomycetaceae bacterium]|nr:hypothetical protein [Planctomycetaceae bacterium]